MSQLFDAVGQVHRALQYHLERHNVIASNVANVDTPGFEPMELLRESEATSALRRLAPVATHRDHLGVVADDGLELVTSPDATVQPGGDGNSVSLEREMSKLSANTLRYEGAARIVSRQLAMLRYAANDGHS
jgi:flagellar basal-body rod protein FlgB